VFQLRDDLKIDTPKLKSITDHMLSEMDAGLASAGTSSLLMIPTHLTAAPTGRETGSFLALDLGGTNFRVLKVL
jgi:hexokinase